MGYFFLINSKVVHMLTKKSVFDREKTKYLYIFDMSYCRSTK